MGDRVHALFHTPLDTCGIAWGPAGITAVQLPEASAEATRARLLRSLPGFMVNTPPETEPSSTISNVRAPLAGHSQDNRGHRVLHVS